MVQRAQERGQKFWRRKNKCTYTLILRVINVTLHALCMFLFLYVFIFISFTCVSFMCIIVYSVLSVFPLIRIVLPSGVLKNNITKYWAVKELFSL